MLGPEAIPYGSIGSYANALAAQYNLSDWQTKHVLVNDIPAKDLPTVSREIYEQTASLADHPKSPEYFGALESIAWADKLDISRQRYAKLASVIGAGVAGAAATAAESTLASLLQNTSHTTATSAQGTRPFIEETVNIGTSVGPVLLAGMIGALVGRKFGPKLRKATAQYVARNVQRETDPGKRSIDGSDYPYTDLDMLKVAGQPQSPTGNHLERVEETGLYATAKKWAQHDRCDDERQYANFLLADMPAGELSKMIYRTKNLHGNLLNNSVEASPEDPRYRSLLHDLQIARDVAGRRAATRTILCDIYRGVGYVGAVSYFGFIVSLMGSTDTDPLTYSTFFWEIGGVSATTAAAGAVIGKLLSPKIDFLTRKRAKRAVRRAAHKTDPSSSDPPGAEPD